MSIHRSHGLVTFTATDIAERIVVVRGQRVLLDADLGRLYGVSTRSIHQAVGRNPTRFPADFSFLLVPGEVADLMSQSVTSSWGGRRKPVRAFTEQGVGMLASVLRSQRAAEVNVAFLRAFVQMRKLLVDYGALAERVDELENKYSAHDQRIAAVFEAIRQLLQPPADGEKDRIGFTRPP